jgi:RNA polymerase sigma-70 factor (ECF subfamily)
MSLAEALARGGSVPTRRDPAVPCPGRGDLLGEAFRLYYDAFVRRLERKGVSPASAEGLVQEVFLNAHKVVSKEGVRESLPKLLSRILRLVLSAYRRSKRRRPPTEDVDEIDVPASESDTEQQVALGDAAWLIDAALERLPPEMAEVLRLVELEGMTAGEAAAILGRPASTVRDQHRRGLARLAQEVRRLLREGTPRAG